MVVKHTFAHVLAQLAYTGEAMLHNKTPETDGSVLGVEIYTYLLSSGLLEAFMHEDQKSGPCVSHAFITVGTGISPIHAFARGLSPPVGNLTPP